MTLAVRTGTFNAATSTGNQAVSWSPAANWPDGTVPDALILWGVGTTTDGAWTTNWFTEGIGFATSPTNQYAQSAADFGGIAIRRRMEACAFIQTNVNTTIIRRADLVSMDADGFTINWTVVRADGDFGVLGYTALGGSDLTGATVANWQMPASTGNKSVTGVGFTPDVAIHVHAGGLVALTDGGGGEASVALGIGVMTPTDQWATSINQRVSRNQEPDKCLTVISGTTVFAQAEYTSMDADGFTVNFGTSGSAWQVISLCLQGGQYDAGTITKSTATGNQVIGGIGFEPSGLLLAGVQDIARVAPVADVVYGLGMTDGTSQLATALSGNNTENYTTSSAIYVKNNPTTSQDIDAVATLSSMDADGYTLNWTTNDAALTVIGYLAFGDAAPPPAAELDLSVSGTGTMATSLALAQSLALDVSGQGSMTAALSMAQRLGLALAGQGALAITVDAESGALSLSLTGQGAATFGVHLAQALSLDVMGTGDMAATLATSMRLGGLQRTVLPDPLIIDRTTLPEPFAVVRTTTGDPLAIMRTDTGEPLAIQRTNPTEGDLP